MYTMYTTYYIIYILLTIYYDYTRTHLRTCHTLPAILFFSHIYYVLHTHTPAHVPHAAAERLIHIQQRRLSVSAG